MHKENHRSFSFVDEFVTTFSIRGINRSAFTKKLLYTAYKFKAYPTPAQEQILAQWVGCGRKVWNLMLEHNKQKYDQEKKFVFYVEMNNRLPDLKKTEDLEFLKNAPSQVLQQKCQDLSGAITRSFRSGFGFPKFKARNLDHSGIRFPQGFHLNGNRITLPKMKGLKFKKHREIEGAISSCTVKRDRCGDWWVVLLAKQKDKAPMVLDPTKAIGIDVGLKEFAVTSDGEIIKNPRFLRRSEKRLKIRQRSLSRTQKASMNRERCRLRLARTYRKVTRQRTDFIDKVVSSITKSYDIIGVEDLNIAGMKKNHKLAKSIGDVSWGRFFMRLQQKANQLGKIVIKTDAFAPTSKTCSRCGAKQEMPLWVRTYRCTACHVELDRDFNAAVNIKNWSMRKYDPTVGITGSNAFGDMIHVYESADEATTALAVW